MRVSLSPRRNPFSILGILVFSGIPEGLPLLRTVLHHKRISFPLTESLSSCKKESLSHRRNASEWRNRSTSDVMPLLLSDFRSYWRDIFSFLLRESFFYLQDEIPLSLMESLSCCMYYIFLLAIFISYTAPNITFVWRNPFRTVGNPYRRVQNPSTTKTSHFPTNVYTFRWSSSTDKIPF